MDLNEGIFTQIGMDLDSIRASRSNLDTAPRSDKEKALLKLAIKSVDAPENVTQTDMEAARRQDYEIGSTYCVHSILNIKACLPE